MEYSTKINRIEENFYHQNIRECLSIADIYISNETDFVVDGYSRLKKQILKYIALATRPGLVNPTHLERCMQLAFNAKYNSGCLSRQVGAVVTRDDFSIQSIGWNDIPKGHVSCNLRSTEQYMKRKDYESFTEYEETSIEFKEAIAIINEGAKGKTSGRCMSYCFKDVYNGIQGDKNQIYTRALHAEENAFLQISKYGGTKVEGGYLFTTASPCEMCSRKAYQLGIRKIFYIDPYPGISNSLILTFGRRKNKFLKILPPNEGQYPEMNLFYGAVGRAYLQMYEQKMPIKDELEMLSGINQKSYKDLCKKEVLQYGDICYEKVIIEWTFENRHEFHIKRKIRAICEKDGLKEIYKTLFWTGSKYVETKLDDCKDFENDNSNLEIIDDKKNTAYTIRFKEEKSKVLMV